MYVTKWQQVKIWENLLVLCFQPFKIEGSIKPNNKSHFNVYNEGGQYI